MAEGRGSQGDLSRAVCSICARVLMQEAAGGLQVCGGARAEERQAPVQLSSPARARRGAGAGAGCGSRLICCGRLRKALQRVQVVPYTVPLTALQANLRLQEEDAAIARAALHPRVTLEFKQIRCADSAL